MTRDERIAEAIKLLREENDDGLADSMERCFEKNADCDVCDQLCGMMLDD